MFRLQTFGQPALFATTNSEQLLGPGKPLALLAFCCAVRNREHSRDYLTTLLWSDSEATRGRQNLRQAMWRLRSVIGEAFQATEDAVTGISDAVAVDRDEFVEAIHQNDGAAALAKYQGAFLLGMSIPGGDELEDWAANERRLLEDSLIRVVAANAKVLVSSGRVATARNLLDQLLKRTPDNVDAHRIALELTLQVSDTSGAQKLADVLERLSRVHERETPAIQALIARARQAPRVSSPQAEALSLDLVGREEIFSAVMESWAQARGGSTQAVSLTGAPGIGKTRLLTALAQRCQSKGAIAVLVKANQGERDVSLALAAAIARALASRPGAAGISVASARELVALDPSLGSHFATAPSAAVAPDDVRMKALAVLDLLGAICDHQPLALMLDDLHWSDSPSRQMLSIIVTRAAEMPLMFVIASRGHAQPIGGDAIVNYPLLPLRNEDIVDAIRSTGSWPNDRDADSFISTLGSVCQGVPFAILERLRLVRDRELVTYRDSTWSSTDWPRATAEVAIAAPIDQRIGTCSSEERRALLAIAVAGVPQTEAHLWRALQEPGNASGNGPGSPTLQDLSLALASLEVRGLIVRMHEMWLPVHDVIAERLLEMSTVAERQAVHLQLARIASDGEWSAASIAFRHFVAADDDDNASREFRRVVKYQRSIGDTRPAREILQQLGGDRLTAARSRAFLSKIPLFSRQSKLRARWVVGPLLAACVVLALIVATMLKQPHLTVSQAPMTTFPSSAYSARTLRTRPSVAIAVGREGSDLRERKVYVRAVDGGTRVVSGDSASVVAGVALFNTLRFESSEPVVRLQFSADGYAPTTLTVTNPITSDLRGLDESARLRLIGGSLNGRLMTGGSSQVRVGKGAEITGIVQAEYSAHWPTASVWLSMTPSWGEPRMVGADVTPVLTPVRREAVDVPVSLRAPNEAGRYWILFAMDAEDSGGYLLSRTNWTVGHPIWSEGNEIARLSDADIRRANAEGFVDTRVAYSRDWKALSLDCRPITVERERPLKLCLRPVALFGIEVVVE